MDTSILTQDQVAALVSAPEQFPVDFDYAWQWLGYSRKDHGLAALKANFL